MNNTDLTTRIGSQYVTNAPKLMYSLNGIPLKKNSNGRTDKRTHGQTNGRTDGRSDYIMPQILFGGIKKFIVAC